MSNFRTLGRKVEIVGHTPGIQPQKQNVDDDRVPEQKPDLPVQDLTEVPSGVDRIYDPRKLQHMQLKDINEDVIDQYNREDAATARQQASTQRESRIRQDKAKAAMDKQLKDQKERQFYEAKQNLERQGIEYETDFEGRPLIKRDGQGKPVFKKKTGEIEKDDEDKSVRYDRDAKGNIKKVYPDKDAPIERDETVDDGFIYKKNKHSEWQKIDPEEGILSEDRKTKVASAKELYRREKERLETTLANPDLPKGPTPSKKKELKEEIAGYKSDLKQEGLEDQDIIDYNNQIDALELQLNEGAEREGLERELFGLRKGGAASFLGKYQTKPKEDTADSLRQESENLKKSQEELKNKYQGKIEEAQEAFSPKSGVSADESIGLDQQKQAQRSFADIQSDYEKEAEESNARIALLNKRRAEYNSRQEAKRQEAKEQREASIVKIESDPFLTENAQAIRDLDTDFDARFGKLEEIENTEERQAASQALQEEYKKANQANWESIEESNERRAQALWEIGMIEASVMREIKDVRMPGSTSMGYDQNMARKVSEKRDAIKNTLPDRIRKVLTDLGYNEPQIEAAIQDDKKLSDVNRNRIGAALLSNGSISVASKFLWNDKEADSAINGIKGATEEQKSVARQIVQHRQEELAPEIIRQFKLTAFGDEWNEFEKEFQRKWSSKNDGNPAPDYEVLKGFNSERKDLWNNIEWEKFMLNNAQMLAWIIPGEKMKVAGNEIKKQSEALAQIGSLIDDQSAFLGFSKSELLGGALSLLPSMAPGIGIGMASTRLGLSAVTASRIGLGATALSAGVQSAAPSYFDARSSWSQSIYAELIEENGGLEKVSIEKRAELQKIANERADKQSLWLSLGSGAITSLITAAGGTKGVESLLRPKQGFIPIRQVVRQFSKTGLRNTIKSKRFYTNILKTARDFGINASEEFVEEFSDQLFNGILEANTFNPDKSFNEILAEAWKAGTMGAVLGGGVGGATSFKDGASESWKQWRNAVKRKESSLESIENPSDQLPVPIGELEPSDQVSRIDAEIDNWDAGDIDPASADLDRRLAKTAARLAVGDVDSINNSDLELIGLKRGKDGTLEQGKPSQGDTTWTTVQNGVPIISQELLDSLRSRHEQLGQILPESEESQRKAIPTEEEQVAEPAQEPTPEPAQEEPAEPIPGEGQLFNVQVEGREEPVQVRAANQDEAISQVARQNIGLVQSATLVQEPTPEPTQEEEQAFNEITAQLEADQGKPLTKSQKAGVRKAYQAVSGAINKWGQIFSSVGWTLDQSPSGGLYVQDGKLTVSVPDLLRTFNAVDSPGSWANKAALEEAIHLAAVQLEQEGKLDVIGLYKSMPKEIQAATEKLYPTQVPEGQRDYILAHEFLRFFLQGKINVKDGKWSAEGDIITEQSSPGFIAKLRETLQGILDFFAGIETQNTEFASELRKAEQLVRSKLSELSGLDLEQKSDPKPKKKVTKKKVDQKQAPTRGPPKKKAPEGEEAQFKAWEKGEFKKGEDFRNPYTGKMQRRIPTARGMRIINVPKSKAPKKPEFIEGRKAKVIQGKKKVKVQYIVQEADEGKPSHDAQGRKTKGYPQDLQPRDRSTEKSQRQADLIARNLDFDTVAFFPGTDTPATTAKDGAPIMLQNGFTLTGNGREIGIIESYKRNHPASQKYKKELISNASKFGLDPEQVSQMKNPVLKRVILDELTDAELVNFSETSNESEAMAMTAVELSGQDASRITPELLMLFDPEFRLDTQKNKRFREAYTEQVIQGGGDKVANISNADLLKRIRMGIFAAAYGLDAEGRAALDRMSGEMGENAKRLSNALETVSPMVARMRRDIELGVLENMDVSEDIAGAVQEIEVALREAKNVKLAWEQLAGQSQFAFDERGVKDLVLGFMVEHKGHRATIEEAIGNYVDLVYQLGDPRQAEIFTREELPTKEELWKRATKPKALVKDTALATQDLFSTFSKEGKKVAQQEIERKAFWKKQSPELQKAEQDHFDSGIIVDEWQKPILQAWMKFPSEVKQGLLAIAEENSKVPPIPDSIQNELQKGLDEVARIEKENEGKYIGDWKSYVAKYKPFKPVLDKRVNEIADKLGAVALHGPIKGTRGIAKAVHKANEITRDKRKINPKAKRAKVSMSRVKDVIRSSLIGVSDSEVTKLVDAIYENFNVIHNSKEKGDIETLRKEKRLHKDRFKNPKGEYRDHLFLVEISPGIIAEIQVHRADILHAKEVGPGHKFYEDTRSLEESKIIKKNNQASQHYKTLFGHMNIYYKTGQDYRNYSERPAAMRSASAFVTSTAPDSMNFNSVIRSMSDKGSASPTRLANPGPISQGIFSSERTYLFSSAINQDGTMNTAESQRFEMFQEYKSGLPAKAKASRVAFERKVNRDFKSLGKDRAELVNAFIKYQFALPIKRGENESPKEFRRRVIENYPEPKKLPKNPKNYFDESQATAPVVSIPVSSLTTVRAREGGIANAEKLMAAAADGVIPKRKPVDLRDNGDGTFTVLDGNSTTAIARKHDFAFLIGQVVETPALGTQQLDTDTADRYDKLAEDPDANEEEMQKIVDKVSKKAEENYYKKKKTYLKEINEYTEKAEARIQEEEDLVSNVFIGEGKWTEKKGDELTGTDEDFTQTVYEFTPKNIRGVIESRDLYFPNEVSLAIYKSSNESVYTWGDDQYSDTLEDAKSEVEDLHSEEALRTIKVRNESSVNFDGLPVPPDMEISGLTAGTGSVYIEGRNFIDEEEFKYSIRDHEPSVFRENQFGYNTAFFEVNFANPSEIVNAVEEVIERIENRSNLGGTYPANIEYMDLAERFGGDIQLRSQQLDGSLDQGDILMLKPEGKILEEIKTLQDEAVANVPGMQPLAEEDLHFTLVHANLNDQVSIKNQEKPNFNITLEPMQSAVEVKPSGEVRRSVFARVTEQGEFKKYTDKVIGKKSPDTRRDYHITLATSTGNPKDAISYPGKGSPRILSSQDLSYRGQHSAPGSDFGGPLHDLSLIYPDDIYSINAPRYYGTGSPIDAESFRIANKLKGEPDANVTIYRAVPASTENEATENIKINPGDWVAISKAYAREHGVRSLNNNYRILQKTVKAKEVFTNGDSINEWGYETSTSKLPSQDLGGKKPSREKMADAMIAANQMLPGNRSRKQFAYEYRNAMPNQKWLTAYELGNRLFRGSAEGKAASQTILNRWVESGLVDRMWTEDGTPIYAWSGTKPEKGLLTLDQINKKYPEDAPQLVQGKLLSQDLSSLDTEYLNLAKDPKKNEAKIQDMVNAKAKQNGFTKKLYHGTWADFFEVFREGSHFSPVKEYADRYQSTWASSQSRGVSGRKVPVKPRTMEFWVRMDNPFDTSNDPKAHDIFYEEFYRKHGTGTSLNEKSSLPDWTDGIDLFDFIKEHYPEYDGIILDEGAEPAGQPGEIIERPPSVIPLKSYQIKSTDPVTKDKEGNIIPLSERFNESSDSILRTQSFADMVGDDAANEIDQLYNQALNEESGKRTIGDPAKGLGAEDPEIMAVDEYRKNNVEPETFEQWNEEARKMLEDDYEGTFNMLLNRGFEGGTLDPVQTRAAQLIVAEEMSKPLTAERRDRVQKLVYSYRSTGTEQARGLAARRDPFKTPADRHKEFLGKIFFTPPAKVRKELAKAETREEKEKILKKDQIRLLKIQKELEKMGITFEDIFSGEIELTLKGAKIVKNITESYSDKQKRAFELLSNNKPFKEVSKETGLSIAELKQIKASFIEELKRKHYKKFEKGLKADSLETDKIPGLGTQDVSPEQAEAEFQRALLKMGIVPDRLQGKIKKKTRKKTARKKPPGYSSPEEQKRWEEFKDKELDPTEETEQEVMRLFDIDDIIDVVRVARIAQAAESNAFDMIQEYWINNILSGPQTHLVNIAGNVANAAWDLSVQRGMESLINLAVKDKKGATIKEYKHIIKGILPGVSRGIRLAATAWGTEVDFFRTSVLGEEVSLESGYIKGEKIRTAIPGKTGKVIRTPGRTLLLVDSFFKGLFGTMEAGAQAYRIAKSEGLKGKELEERIAELTNTPNSQAWQLAVDRAEGYAFQTRVRSKDDGGGVVESLVHSIIKLKNSNKLTGFIIPFIQTPFNIFRIGIRKSPIGSVGLVHRLASDGLFKIKDGKPLVERYPELVRDLAEQVLAWTTLSLLYGAAEGDEDDDDKFFMITGSKPLKGGEAGIRKRKTGGDYMIKIGKVMIPYGRIEPFSTMIGTTVDIIRSMKTESTPKESMERMYAWMLSQVQSKTFIRGIGDLTRGIRNPEQLGDYGKRFVLQSFVPNLIRQPIRNVDKYDREWQTKEWWYDVIPLPSGAKIKVDPSTGKPIEKAGTAASRIAIPKFTDPQKLSESDQLLDNWNRNNPGETWGPANPPRVLKVDDKDVELNPNSYSYLIKRTATLAQRELKGKIPGITIRRPKEKDLDLVKNAYAKGRRKAREELRRRPIKKLGKTKD